MSNQKPVRIYAAQRKVEGNWRARAKLSKPTEDTYSHRHGPMFGKSMKLLQSCRRGWTRRWQMLQRLSKIMLCTLEACSRPTNFALRLVSLFLLTAHAFLCNHILIRECKSTLFWLHSVAYAYLLLSHQLAFQLHLKSWLLLQSFLTLHQHQGLSDSLELVPGVYVGGKSHRLTVLFLSP